MQKSSEKYEALGLNIFGGGFTLGVLDSGRFHVSSQYEECDAGAKTFDLNVRRYFTGIRRPLRFEEWDPFVSPRLIYANPPCAPWSAANVRTGISPEVRHRDPRLTMTKRSMEFALAVKPDVFALETVARGYSMGRAYYDGWAEQWIKNGYGVTYYLTDALLLGVPSTRQRFHFIAHQNDLVLADDVDTRNFIPRTVSQAIGDLQDRFGHLPHHMPRRMSKAAHELCKIVKEGRLLTGTDDEDNSDLQWAVTACEWKPSFLNHKLVWDAPAYTIVNLEQHVHPRRPRFLTWREGLRLTGYPDDFMVAQPQGATQAVLPIMGKHIAELAAGSLDCGTAAQKELRLVDHREYAKPFRPGNVRRALEEGYEL
jgi:site-specific DNA-cytosine methylase